MKDLPSCGAVLTFAAAIVGGGDGAAVATGGFPRLAPVLVGDAVHPAERVGHARPSAAAPKAGHAVWHPVLIEHTLLVPPRAGHRLAGGCNGDRVGSIRVSSPGGSA